MKFRMKEKILKVVKSKWFFFVFLFIFLLVLHSFMNFSNDDINFFSNQLDVMSWFDFIKMRYQIWTSRLLIEGLLVYLSRTVFLWRIINSFVICLLVFSIDRLIFSERKVSNLIFISLICFIYPYWNMKEAGFCATTLNYLWPLTFLVFSFIPLRDLWERKELKKRVIPFYLLAFVYACNQEQAVCVGLVVSLFMLILSKDNKVLRNYSLVMFLISGISLGFILTCPGNDIRSMAEINNWYPDYVHADLFDKFYLGVVSTCYLLIRNIFVLWLFSLVLGVLVLKKVNKFFPKFVAILQFLFISVLAVFRGYTWFFNYHYDIFEYFTDVGNVFQFQFKNIIVLCLCLGMVLIFCYLLYMLLQKKSCFIIFILLLGCGTRLLMGFSPTIFASGSRTMIFLYFAILFIIIYLWSRYRDLFSKRQISFFYGGIVLLALVNCIMLFYYLHSL